MDVLPPFSYTYSDNINKLLGDLRFSLAVTLCNTGKLVMFSPTYHGKLVQLPRNIPRPMGMAVWEERFAIAAKNEVIIHNNESDLANLYPKQPNTYDALFLPRVTMHCGALDLHEIEWTSRGLVAINTKFSCLSLINANHAFSVEWKPNFVTEMLPEDRCHLNGLACEDGIPKYVTALGVTDSARGWKEGMLSGGVLIDIESNESVLENLPVPRSPRIYEDGVFMLLSGTGELVKVNTESHSYDVIAQLPGFARGMDRIGNFIFIGLSKIRIDSKPFIDLPVAENDQLCGVAVVDLTRGEVIAYIKYENTVDEIFDVKVLHNMMRPNLVNKNNNIINHAYSNSYESMWVVPEDDLDD
jgi:uncharacterized protein (TIGR03032 family)